MNMKIDYVSDLHLEFQDYHDFSKETGGDILILAGDIFTADAIRANRTDPKGRGLKKYVKTQLIDGLFNKYSHVLYVMGNHEHYHWLYWDSATSLRKSLKDLGAKNVVLLDNDVFSFGDIRFLGTTLWSDYEGRNALSMWTCEQYMNDYRLIGNRHILDSSYVERNNPMYMTPELFLKEHDKALAFLRKELETSNEPTIVISHHGPTYSSLNKKHVGNGADGAYASDLSAFIASFPQISYWIHGHTHMNVRYSVEGTYVIANQRGYRGEDSHRIFGGLKSIEV